MKFLRRLSVTLILDLLLALLTLPLLHVQTAASAPADATVTANPAPSEQAPDAMTNKITALVHVGKYAEAQQLTTGLLVAYPNDQRLIKAKALIEKLLAPAGSTSAAPANRQPAANANVEQLTGMDKVDYNALIVLARQAQQTTDLDQQKASLKQFMDQSSPFLQKHPEQMLLWQLRAASALSLDDLMAGYEAGQALLAAGAADSDDPNLQHLLAQLKNQGWLGKEAGEKVRKLAEIKQRYGWMLGTWSASWTSTFKKKTTTGDGEYGLYGRDVEFDLSDSAPVIEVRGVDDWNLRMTLTILDSGDLHCIPSCEIDEQKRTITKTSGNAVTVFTKIHGTH